MNKLETKAKLISRIAKTLINKTTPWTFTDIRYFLYLIKSGEKKSSSHPKIINSGFSWQERARWNKRVLNFSGKKGQNLKWLTVSNNSEEIARQKLEEKSKLVSGENNPWYNHGGKFSPFSDKSSFYDPTLNEKVIENHKKNKSLPIYKEYWIRRGFTEDEALQKVKQQQTTFSLEKCIEKHGEDAGREIWNKRQEKWLKTLNSKSTEEKLQINAKKMGNGYSVSKAEKELYESLKECCVEKQFCIIHEGKAFIYDFRFGNRLIEYNGDYWHCNPSVYDENYYNTRTNKTAKETWEADSYKIQFAKNLGFDVLVVWEKDYEADKQKVIQECINFLNQ